MFFNSVEHAIYQNGALFAGQLLLPDGFVPWTFKKVVQEMMESGMQLIVIRLLPRAFALLPSSI